MKIKIVNFGPIKEFEFDLSKKLIVTYGDNNIGKSYAMQVVYLLLKAFQDFPTEEMTSMLLRFSKFIEKMQKEKTSDGIKSDDKATEQEVDISNAMLNVVMQKFMTSCRNTFGNLDVTLSKSRIFMLKWMSTGLILIWKKRQCPIAKAQLNMLGE